MRQDTLYLNAELSPAEQRAVQRQVAAGELYRVRAGIATPLPESEWPALFRREKARLLAALFPGSVVSYRSAFDGMVGTTIYLASGYARVVELPGLKLVISKGAGPVDGDARIQGREFYFPSRERMLLDAMAPTPREDDPQYSRRISAEELEIRLISICDSRGEASFLDLRERVRVVGAQLGTPKTHLYELDRLIGAILGTRPDRKMSTSQGTGRAKGYDAPRMDLFHKLVQVLKTNGLQRIEDVAGASPGKIHFAFLESYFSNFIEGTEFEIGEARAIALEGKISELRPKDSHDIVGVFSQAQEPAWRARGISNIKTFEETLRERHARMMAARPEVLPGEFKMARNVAGNTTFVEPRLVLGTLREAGLLLHDVEAGLPRALLTMFIVSEVHPFNDGNGRLARLMMNSELSASGEARIIVPTLYREQYLDCLRELTRAGRTEPYLDAMEKIQRWTASFDYEDLDGVIDLMRLCNALEKSLVEYKLLCPQDLDDETTSAKASWPRPQ
jgi:hypothetical protein